MFFRFSGFVLIFFVGVLLAFDAHQRGVKYPILWFIGTVVFPIIVVPAYFLFFRNKAHIRGYNKSGNSTLLCPKCGTENTANSKVCSKCKNKLDLK